MGLMETAIDIATIRDFAIALMIGALVGVEREKTKAAENDPAGTGLRSFILIALVGAVSGWLGKSTGHLWLFGLGVLSVSATVVAGYVLGAMRNPDSLGRTTEMAAIAVVLLGGMATLGHPEIAVALGIVVSAVLAYRKPLHGLIERLGYDDIFAGLKLLIASFIVLPILPVGAIDPWGVLKPYSLWFLVILISSLSLVGYVATRLFGAGRGAAVTGFTGGLVSSTAVTLSFARESRQGGGAGGTDALATGILLAWGVMFVRAVVEVAVVHPPLVGAVVVPLAAMGVTALGSAALLYRRAMAGNEGTGSGAVPLKNPFSLTEAVKFALIFAVVLLVVEFARRNASVSGIYAVAALAGLTDVDAITLSMAKFARDGGDARTAVTAISIAAFANTVGKCGLVFALGGASLKGTVAISAAVIVAVGAGALIFL